ncbi:cytochrome C [bacterium]|nr:cytochrome C [bacterium]MBU1990679.1 cytochrome C [bacterium]
MTITKTIAPAPLKSGADIYKACIGCHGANAEKPALGKSQIIKSWSSEKIAQALNGYKNATYGGAMKGVMLGQVSKLNAADIKLVSDYISKL